MDKPSEQSVIPPWRELVSTIVQYLLKCSPFMRHAGMVLVFTWIASYLHLNVALICTWGCYYLCQVQYRQRERLNWKIRHEERNKANRMRIPEGETVRWMNQMVERIWPMFLEDFAAQILLVPVTSVLNRSKPWTAKKLILQNLSLGKTPPKVTMVRILEQPVDGDNLAIEATLEWMAAKDMAAVLAVKLRRRVGLGIWTTLHICDLELEGKVKVGMKFKDGARPVIERIRVCFATAPYIELAAHPLSTSGVDVSELPGIASWMDRLVADAFAQSLVEPKFIEIDVEKLMRDVMRPQGPAQPPGGDWCSMRGTPPAAEVKLEVLEATDLRVGDLNGFSDPFVKVTVGNQHRQTKVKRKTLNPKWAETFRFSITSWEQPNTMVLNVRDKDHVFDDQLGCLILEINQYRDGKRHDIWLPLVYKAVEIGKIHLAIMVVDRETDSQSSEDTSYTNSTTLEKADQVMSQECDGFVPSEGLTTPPSPGYGLSQALAASPKDRVSARQRLKNLKPGKGLSGDPAAEDRSGRNVGRQRSGVFSSSRSSRKLETPQLGSEREKPPIPSEEYSAMASCGLTSPSSSTPMEAEVTDPSSDDTTVILDVGFGEHGAVKICQLGDIQPTPWPRQRVVGSKRSEAVIKSVEGNTKAVDQASLGRESLTSGGGTRQLGSRLHGKLHRARMGFEKDAEPGSPSQDLQSRRRLSTSGDGARGHPTLDLSGGQPEKNSSTGLASGPEPTARTSLSVEQGGEVTDAGTSVGDRDPDKQHLRSKAKGFFGKAAGHMSHQLSKKMNRGKKKDKEGSSSSEEVITSGELTPMGGSGVGPATKELGPSSEVPVTGPGAQQQPPSTSKQVGATLPPAPTPSEPPSRPPPGLPQGVAPINGQADNEKIQSSEPL